MPTVIGYDDSLKLKCTCKNCTAIIEYLPKEVKSNSYRDYGGFSDTYYEITCPTCSKQVRVPYPKT